MIKHKNNSKAKRFADHKTIDGEEEERKRTTGGPLDFDVLCDYKCGNQTIP